MSVCNIIFDISILNDFQQCCYDSTTGLWINDRPNAGTFLHYNPLVTAYAEHSFTHDIASKVACCDMSDNCDLYYERHPIGDCYRKTWFQFGKLELISIVFSIGKIVYRSIPYTVTFYHI